jgi:hypothetical protein
MSFFAKLTAYLLLSAFAVAGAKAHEAVTGWHYPGYCCGEGDCSHAESAVRNSDGSLTVTTKHGTATFPVNYKHEPSPDGLIHACFTPTNLYCLYLSTGI